MEKTLVEWYHMIWQCKVPPLPLLNVQIAVVVCFADISNTKECAKYFEKKAGKKMSVKRFTIRTASVRALDDTVNYELRIKNKAFFTSKE